MEKLENYEFNDEKILGEGAYSKVSIVKNKKLNHYQALKVIDISKLCDMDIKNLTMEIKIHSGLHHPNIIKFHEYFQVKNVLYISLELASNGMLFYLIP